MKSISTRLLLPTTKLADTLDSIIENKDQARLNKFFKRHRADINVSLMSNHISKTVTEVKHMIEEQW